MIKTVIFDVYGTLVSTGTGSVDAARCILEKNGRPDIDAKAFYGDWKRLHRKHMDGLPHFETEAAIFAMDLAALYEMYKLPGDAGTDVTIMLDTLGQRAAFPEAQAVLSRLAERYTVVIGSTTDTEPLMRDLARNALTVHRVFTSEALMAYKPQPAFYRGILEALVIPAEEALFVGDSLLDDVQGPQGVGMHTCWVNRKGAEPGAVRPEYVVDDLKGLLPILMEK